MQCFEFQKHENYIYITLAMHCIVLFVSLIKMNKKTGNQLIYKKMGKNEFPQFLLDIGHAFRT